MSSTDIGGLESAAEPRTPERATFPCFDGFRALAAGGVLVTHVAFLSGFNGRSPLGAFTSRLDVGVAVFFMISGFLLYRPFVASSLAEREQPRTVAYFWRRALRILPAYWVALTITVFVLHVPENIPSPKELFLYYSLSHLYSVGNVTGPILSSYTLVTEISFYVFLPLYAFAIARAVHGTPKRRAQVDLAVLSSLVLLGIVYRAVVLDHFSGARAGQLLNILPGWIDVFAVGMALAVVSAWLAGDREPTWLRSRAFPVASWALAAVAFAAISLWIGRPGTIRSSWQDLGVHYAYLAVALFFLLPGIFGRQHEGVVRAALQNRGVQLVGLVSYGLYLWNETWLEKYLQWTDATPFATSFVTMLVVVFAGSLVVAAASYVLVERPALALKSRVPSRS